MFVRNITKINYRILGHLFLLLFQLFGCKNATNTVENRTHTTYPLWLKTADSLFEASDSLSGVLLIAENDSVKLLKAKGYKDFINQIPIESTDIFELASVSKQYTAAAIMLLEQKGKLDYDDSLQQYFPNLPYPEVTIRHMLHHTSGLPDYMQLFYDYWDKSKVAGNKEILEYLEKYRPAKLFSAGERYEYSNTGYVLLASIVEEVSGQDFVDFVEKEIFLKAGLEKTKIRSKSHKLTMDNMAWGYIFDSEKEQYMPADSFPYTDYATFLGERKGPGRVSSDALDLFKWDSFLANGNLFEQTTLRVAASPAQLNNGEDFPYGFGWDIAESNKGSKILKHNGENPGYRTIIIRLLDKRRVIVLLTNNQPSSFDSLSDQLHRIIDK